MEPGSYEFSNKQRLTMTTTSALFSAFLNPPRIILNFSNNHQKFNPCKNSNPSFNRSSWIKNPNPLFIQIPNKIQITHQTKKLNPNSTIQNSSHGPPNPKNTNTRIKEIQNQKQTGTEITVPECIWIFAEAAPPALRSRRRCPWRSSCRRWCHYCCFVK